VGDKTSNTARNPETHIYLLEARVGQLRGCEIKAEGPKHAIHDQKGSKVGHLRYDTQVGKVPTEVRYKIIGRDIGQEDGERVYYVLFVTK